MSEFLAAQIESSILKLSDGSPVSLLSVNELLSLWIFDLQSIFHGSKWQINTVQDENPPVFWFGMSCSSLMDPNRFNHFKSEEEKKKKSLL